MPGPAEPDRSRFPVLLAVAFVALAGIGLARHEMWRDEMQAWLIPLESGSPAELLHNLRYEGHPALWHFLLWIVTRFTRRPEAMQVLHLAVSAAAVFLFARYAPFPRYVRALSALGYYPLYEYTVISRNYGIGMLLLFAACALFPGRRRSYLPLAAVLSLLAHANPYAWLIAAAFAGTLIAEALGDRELRRGDAALGLLLFAASAALAAMQMMPPPDGAFATSWHLSWRPARAFHALAAVARAWLPLPDPGAPGLWNSSILHGGAAAGIAVVLMATAAALLRRCRPALWLYLGGSAALLGFTYLKYLGYARHHGAHFLLLLACLWIARRSHVLLPLLLGIHVAAGAWLWVADVRHPFSAARAAAGFLRGFEGELVVGHPDLVATPVAGYLGRPLFHLETGRPGTYVLWNRERTGRRDICRLRLPPEGAVLVTNRLPPACARPRELAGFQALLPDERYRVYRIPGR